MKTLRSLINELNIKSPSQLAGYIEENYSKRNPSPFTILKADDLIRGDSEDRIFDDKVHYENTIFDMDRLEISNSKEISFKDCIFTGELRIGSKENDLLSIHMDYVFFGNKLTISGVQNKTKIELVCVNSPELYVLNNHVDSIDISSSNFANFCVECNYSNFFNAYFNHIKGISLAGNKFNNISFPSGQVDISWQKNILKEEKSKEIITEFNYLDLPKIKFNHEKSRNQGRDKRIRESFRFLLDCSDYHLNDKEHAQLKYLEGLPSSNDNAYKRYVYIIFGGLIMPLRVFVVILTFIFVFSCIYLFPVFQFNVSNNDGDTLVQGLSFFDALYFSGISFTTIGYGDISPVGYSRILAVIEGLAGIFLSGSFLISLVRRYIDK